MQETNIKWVFIKYESCIPTCQKEDFHTHYYIGVSTYAVILKCFIWILTIWRVFPEKIIILWTSFILVLSHSWMTYIQLKLVFSPYLKGMIFFWVTVLAASKICTIRHMQMTEKTAYNYLWLTAIYFFYIGFFWYHFL